MVDLPILPLLAAGVVAGTLVTAALTDALRMTIPNPLVMVLLATFAVIAIIGPVRLDLVDHGLAFLGVLAVGLGIYATGVLGAGDVKLAAALALWTGLGGVPDFLLAMGLAGGALALAILLGRRAFAPILLWAEASGRQIPLALRGGGRLPYGPAIAVAGLIQLPAMPGLAGVLG